MTTPLADLGSFRIRAVGLHRPVLRFRHPIRTAGGVVEGRLQEPGFLSFVGLERIPIRHGLTVGELVSWRARVEGYAELVTVIAATDVDRRTYAADWDRPFVMPSPNMPTAETALVYPGGCLLEGTNLSDGRGTTRPFEITGAPAKIDELVALMRPLGLVDISRTGVAAISRGPEPM